MKNKKYVAKLAERLKRKGLSLEEITNEVLLIFEISLEIRNFFDKKKKKELKQFVKYYTYNWEADKGQCLKIILYGGNYDKFNLSLNVVKGEKKHFLGFDTKYCKITIPAGKKINKIINESAI